MKKKNKPIKEEIKECDELIERIEKTQKTFENDEHFSNVNLSLFKNIIKKKRDLCASKIGKKEEK